MWEIGNKARNPNDVATVGESNCSGGGRSVTVARECSSCMYAARSCLRGKTKGMYYTHALALHTLERPYTACSHHTDNDGGR